MLQMHYQAQLNEDEDDNIHRLGCCIFTRAIFCANNLKWPYGKTAELIAIKSYYCTDMISIKFSTGLSSFLASWSIMWLLII